MIKLNIQKFGGRGASSAPRKEKLSIVVDNESKRINFDSLKRGDTFKLTTDGGRVYNLEVRNEMNVNGTKSYYVEGRLEGESGSYISSLVSDKTFENAKAIDKQFMIPLSRTGNWRRKK